MKNREKYEKAESLRKQGKTLREIGKELGVGPQRVGDMLKRIEWERGRSEYNPSAQLSVRLCNTLRNTGILPARYWENEWTEKNLNELRALVKTAILTGILDSTSYRGDKIKNFGRKSFAELCEWAGIDDPFEKEKAVRQAETIKRMINTLTKLGYRVTKI